MKSPRDIFFAKLFPLFKADKDYYIITCDFGCEVLDKYKKQIPKQVINVGIAEQNAITIACGLALKGKKVFVYGIASFITLRTLDQIRISMVGMNLPITILGIGIGDDYKAAGFTHWAFEDKRIMLEFMEVRNIETKKQIEDAIKDILIDPAPRYLRISRKL